MRTASNGAGHISRDDGDRHRDIGYARISKDDLRRGLGVGRQTEDIHRTSVQTGGTLLDVLIDNDRSASRFATKERQSYIALTGMIQAGAVDRVLIYRIDRLLRVPRQLEDLMDMCEERGVVLVNLHGSIDPTTAEGKKHLRDRVSDAAYESDVLSERLRRAFDDEAAAGRPHGARGFGYACLGMRPCTGGDCCHGGGRPGPNSGDCGHTPRHKRCCQVAGCPHDGVTVIEHEAAAIRAAAQELLAGEGLRAIARRWNEAGLKPAQGGQRFTGTHVRAIMTGPRIAGLRQHRGEVIGVAAWDPIIDRATHESLIRLFNDPGRRSANPPRRQVFTGIIRTADGRAMTRDLVRGARVYQAHRPASVSISAEPLERLIEEMLFGEVESGGVARRVAERRRRESAAPVGEDPAEVERQLVQLADDEASGLVTRAEWLVKRQRLRQRLAAAQAAWRPADADAALDSVDVDIRRRWRLAEGQGGYSADRKRAILSAVFDRIEIRPAARRGPGLDPGRVHPILRG